MKLVNMDKEINKLDESEHLVMPLELNKVENILRSVQKKKISKRQLNSVTPKKHSH